MKRRTLYIAGLSKSGSEGRPTRPRFESFAVQSGQLLEPRDDLIATSRTSVLQRAAIKWGESSAHYDTDVEEINILGYSAGGPLVAGALADLRERYPDLDEADLRRELKITNVFLAASDAGLREFVEEDLKTFHPLPVSIRVTVSRDDPILGTLAVFSSRLGAAKPADLTREELEELDELMPKIDGVDVSHADPGRDGGSFSGHGYWYQNSWVASDVLSSFRWDVPPEDRGLVRMPDQQPWYYPNDYPQRITALVVRIRSGDYVPQGR